MSATWPHSMWRTSTFIPNHANHRKYPPFLFFFILPFMFSWILYWGCAMLAWWYFNSPLEKRYIILKSSSKSTSWVQISAGFFRCQSPQKRLISWTSTRRNWQLTAAIRELLSVSILREGKQGWKLVLTRMVFYLIFNQNILFCWSLLSGYTWGFQGCLLGFWPRRQSPSWGCLSLLSIDIHIKN